MCRQGKTGYGENRFTPNFFQYKGRVAAAMVPCAIFLLRIGGKPVLATLTVGLMLAYILDSLNFKQGAMLAICGSLFATRLAMIFTGSTFTASSASFFLHLSCLFVAFQFMFLVGLWATVHFLWMQLEHLHVVLALERVLFATLPFTALKIQT
jgi:hypothetical protein